MTRLFFFSRSIFNEATYIYTVYLDTSYVSSGFHKLHREWETCLAESIRARQDTLELKESDPRFVTRLASKNASSELGAIIHTKARSIALTVIHIKTEYLRFEDRSQICVIVFKFPYSRILYFSNIYSLEKRLRFLLKILVDFYILFLNLLLTDV